MVSGAPVAALLSPLPEDGESNIDFFSPGMDLEKFFCLEDDTSMNFDFMTFMGENERTDNVDRSCSTDGLVHPSAESSLDDANRDGYMYGQALPSCGTIICPDMMHYQRMQPVNDEFSFGVPSDFDDSIHRQLSVNDHDLSRPYSVNMSHGVVEHRLIPYRPPTFSIHKDCAMTALSPPLVNHQVFDQTAPLPILATPNIWTPQSNAKQSESHTFDGYPSTRGTFLTSTEPSPHISNPKSSALTKITKSKRKLPPVVSVTKSLVPRKSKNDKLMKSIAGGGYLYFQGPTRESSKPNSRKGKPRSKQEQAARDRGACLVCREQKKECRPSDPNQPNGLCVRCVHILGSRPIMLHGCCLTACHRNFANFKEMFPTYASLVCVEGCKHLVWRSIPQRFLDSLDTFYKTKSRHQQDIATSPQVRSLLALLFSLTIPLSKPTASGGLTHFLEFVAYRILRAIQAVLQHLEYKAKSLSFVPCLVKVAQKFLEHIKRSHGLASPGDSYAVMLSIQQALTYPLVTKPSPPPLRRLNFRREYIADLILRSKSLRTLQALVFHLRTAFDQLDSTR